MQKYKIYINDKPLILTSSNSVGQDEGGDGNILKVKYHGKVKQLFSCIDVLEKPNDYQRVIIYSDDLPQLKRDLKSLFHIVKAGGGLVINPDDQLLFIYRKGSWDLPKGKIEKGETKREAAVREVMEETGIEQLRIGKKLARTRHVYRLATGKRVLKITHWYLMQAPALPLVPQTEEDIEIAEWKHPLRFMRSSPRIYNSIRELIHKYFDSSLRPV